MIELITLCFEREAGNTYAMQRICLEEVSENGEIQRARNSTWKHSAKYGDVYFGPAESVSVTALTFVRVAQFQFLRATDTQRVKAVIFRDGPDSSIFKKFRNLFEGARKISDHAPKWLQNMLSLENDAPHLGPCFRLENWFSVSQKKPGGMVECDLAALPPDCVRIRVNSQPVSEVELDHLESFLAIKLNAGAPCFLELDGVKVAGRPPSIQPEWFGQEDECAEIEGVYASAAKPIACIIGRAWTGKTVLATRWLRRLLGNRRARHKFVFAWSFSRQGANTHIQMPSLGFFRHLAELLGVQLGEKSSPVEQANAVLAALPSKPLLLFLDGVEATFARPQPKISERNTEEHDTGLAHLLRGIGATNDSFVIATSQADFTTAFGLAKDSVHVLHLQDTRRPDIANFLAEYEQDPDLRRTQESDRGVAVGELRRVLKGISGHGSSKDLDEWIKKASAVLGPPKGYAPEIVKSGLSETEKRLLNLVLAELKNNLARVLLFIICVSIDDIAQDDLILIAARLPLDVLGNQQSKPSLEDWNAALDCLIEVTILQQAARHTHYSIHRESAGFITQGLKKHSPSLWFAINTLLGELLLSRAPEILTKREEVQPLVHAAIYFCQAGKRRMAYHTIGREKLSRGLKGWIIFNIGDYESPRAVNAAVLGDSDVADVDPIPPETLTLCIHVYALCSTYLDELESALKQELDAWQRAKAIDTANTILPVGCNLLYLFHCFGRLKECKEVEGRMALRLFRDNLKAKFFGDGHGLAKEDVVDGASAVSSFLAMSFLFRGFFDRVVEDTLKAGIKECRNHGEPVEFLLPTYGRPWHALVLLERGQWEICEKAFNAKQWFSEIVPHDKPGTFEILAAKLFLCKAEAVKTNDRAEALEAARFWAEAGLRKARNGNFRWWSAFALLTQGQVFTALRQTEEAERCLETALASSQANSFQLLIVDALLAKAQLAKLQGRTKDCLRQATSALELAETIGYGLRKKMLQKVIKEAKG